MGDYRVLAKIESPREQFERLNVKKALSGEKESIVNSTEQSVIYTVNRTVSANTEAEAREEANNGSLLEAEYEVLKIEKTRDLNIPL